MSVRVIGRKVMFPYRSPFGWELSASLCLIGQSIIFVSIWIEFWMSIVDITTYFQLALSIRVTSVVFGTIAGLVTMPGGW